MPHRRLCRARRRIASHGHGGRASGSATDLEGAVAAAVAASPRGGRVVVLSDGEETTGDATRAAAAARARDVTVDVVPLENSGRRDAAITRVDAPAGVHQGDTISLVVTVRSTMASRATLSVALDGGGSGSQTIQLRRARIRSRSRTRPSAPAGTPSGRAWSSPRRAGGERRAHGKRPGRSTAARDRGVGCSHRPPIAAILAARGLRASVAPPASLPRGAAGYAAVDAVVLDDVPANLLARARSARSLQPCRTAAWACSRSAAATRTRSVDMRTPRSSACSRLRASVPAICSAATSRSSSCWIAPAAWPTPPVARAFPR